MRCARIDRRTTETQIDLRLVLDGKGRYEVSTGIRFLDHMLELVGAARSVRPDPQGDGRPGRRPASHRRGRRNRAR